MNNERTEINTPFSSRVRVLHMKPPNTLFAGGEMDFFRTTDSGQSWDTLITEDTRSLYIFNDSTWYLSTFGGIYLTAHAKVLNDNPSINMNAGSNIDGSYFGNDFKKGPGTFSFKAFEGVTSGTTAQMQVTGTQAVLGTFTEVLIKRAFGSL